jgi:hypothetical protein
VPSLLPFVSREVLIGTRNGLFFIRDGELDAPPARDAEIAGG